MSPPRAHPSWLVATMQLHDWHSLPVALRQAFGWESSIELGRQIRYGADGFPNPERLLSIDRFFDLILRRSLEPPQLRCFQDGDELHPNDYLLRVTSRRRASQRVADPARLSQLLDQGVTIVLDMLDALDPVLDLACRSLQWWIGEYAQVNAYLTTGATAGFPVHWDDHDVIVVQVSGTKSWEVRGLTRLAPMHRDAQPNLTPADEVLWRGTLQPGDVLHVPRGHWHSAHREGEGHSLHVTFGITQRTGVDWLLWVGDQARGDPAFRRDLADDVAARDLPARASALLEASDFASFLASRQDRAEPSRFIYSPVVSPSVDTLLCATQFAPRISDIDDTGTFQVRAAGSQLTFRAAAREVVEACVSGLAVNVTDLEDKFGSRLVAPVVRTLLEARICVPLSEPLRSVFTEAS